MVQRSILKNLKLKIRLISQFLLYTCIVGLSNKNSLSLNMQPVTLALKNSF